MFWLPVVLHGSGVCVGDGWEGLGLDRTRISGGQAENSGGRWALISWGGVSTGLPAEKKKRLNPEPPRDFTL